MAYLSNETNLYKHLVREHWYTEEEDLLVVLEVEDWQKHWEAKHVRRHLEERLTAHVMGVIGGHVHAVAEWNKTG